MSIDFRLTVAGNVPLDEVASSVAPDAVETRTPSGGRAFKASHNEEFGYVVDITSGEHGYVEAEDDDGSQWTWEPERYVKISFAMQKEELADKGVPHMLAAVSRVLTERPEDAALTLNSNWLLLTRQGGDLRKHQPSWWSHYGLEGSEIAPRLG
ncbi:SitI3 family protein [Micromonospora sp. NPDC049366]|uniref:SitI3 family protein n=1 Tax=Micromonospora sp. NPDC049366 TaxID=3364271 RepID=UPI0037A2F59E